MGIRIPQNQIVKSKYTAGKEYMFELTHKEYIGYYYELNNKTFAGKEFNSNSPLLVKIIPENINSLLTKASTYVYGRILKTKIVNTKITQLPNDLSRELNFYCKKINDTNIKIISEESYLFLKLDPLYQTTYIGTYKGNYQSSEQAETQLPGIKNFRDSELEAGRE